MNKMAKDIGTLVCVDEDELTTHCLDCGTCLQCDGCRCSKEANKEE